MGVTYQMYLREVGTNDELHAPITISSETVFVADVITGRDTRDLADGATPHSFALQFLTTGKQVFPPHDPAMTPVNGKVTGWYSPVGAAPSMTTGVSFWAFSVVEDEFLHDAPVLLTSPALQPDMAGSISLDTTNPSWAMADVSAHDAVKPVGSITPHGRGGIDYLLEIDYRFDEYLVLVTSEQITARPDVMIDTGDPRIVHVRPHASGHVMAIFRAEEVGGTFRPREPILRDIWDDPRLWRVVEIIADHPETVAGLDAEIREALANNVASLEVGFPEGSKRLQEEVRKAEDALKLRTPGGRA